MSLIPALIDPRWWILRKKFIERHGGDFAEVNNVGYVIAIVSRGEQLLYEDVLGSIRINLSLHYRCVDVCTLELESSARRKLILYRIKLYFENYQGYSVKITENQIN